MYASLGIGVVCAAVAARTFYVVFHRSPAQRCAVKAHTDLHELIAEVNDTYDIQVLVGKLIPHLGAAERTQLRKDWAVLSAQTITAQRALVQVARMQHPKARASLWAYREIQKVCAFALEMSQEAITLKEQLLAYCHYLSSKIERTQLEAQIQRLSLLQAQRQQLARQGFVLPAMHIEELQEDLNMAEAIMAERPGGPAFDLLAKTRKTLLEMERFIENIPANSRRFGTRYDQEVGRLNSLEELYSSVADRLGKCRYDFPDGPWVQDELALKEAATSFDEVRYLLVAVGGYISIQMLQWQLANDALRKVGELLDAVSDTLGNVGQHLDEHMSGESAMVHLLH